MLPASPGSSPADNCFTPSETTAPEGQVEVETNGCSTSVVALTEGTVVRLGSSLGLAATVTVWYCRLTLTIFAPAARRSSTPAAAARSKRTSTSTRLPARSRLPGPSAARLSASACFAGEAERSAGPASSVSLADSSPPAGLSAARLDAGTSAQANARATIECVPALRRGRFPGCITSYGIGRSSRFLKPGHPGSGALYVPYTNIRRTGRGAGPFSPLGEGIACADPATVLALGRRHRQKLCLALASLLHRMCRVRST